jgi:hypothetical protein
MNPLMDDGSRSVPKRVFAIITDDAGRHSWSVAGEFLGRPGEVDSIEAFSEDGTTISGWLIELCALSWQHIAPNDGLFTIYPHSPWLH